MMTGWFTETTISLQSRVGHTYSIHQLKAQIFYLGLNFDLVLVNGKIECFFRAPSTIESCGKKSTITTIILYDNRWPIKTLLVEIV